MIDPEEKTIKALMSRFADPQRADKKMWEKFKSMEAEDIDNFPIYKQVYGNRQLVVLDVTEQPDLMPTRWTEPFGIKKLLSLPLISQDRVIGILTFDHIDDKMDFSTEQIELAQTIAGQIASTIENATLFDQTMRRAEHERRVTEITTKIRASNDPKVILHTALNELREALKRPKTRVAMQSDGEADNSAQSDNNGQ
jgi:GAF domain-containing protein